MENKFVISKENWDKIINYSQSSYDQFKAEIGGMSIMVKKDNIWELKDPVILKQEVTAGTCDLDKEALAEYYSKTAFENQDKEYRICWWHSHHTMDAFWSGTDKKAIEEYNQGDISFALVVNLREEYKFRVSVWEPIEHGEDVDLLIYDWTREIPDDIAKEVKDLCSKEIKTVNTYRNGWGQRTIWNGQEVKEVPWNTTKAEEYEHDILYAPIQAALDFSKLIGQEYLELTIKRDEYMSEIKKFNDMLAKQGIAYKVKILTKKKLEESEYTMNPTDFIEAEDSDLEELVREHCVGGWS